MGLSCTVGCPSVAILINEHHFQLVFGNGDSLKGRTYADQGVITLLFELHALQIRDLVIKVERISVARFGDNHLVENDDTSRSPKLSDAK